MEITSVNIGGQTLADQRRLLIKDETTAVIEIDGSFLIYLIFHPGPNPNQPGTRLSWTPYERGLKFDAYGWNNTLGESLTDPISLGKDSETQKEIMVMISSRRLGNFNDCNIDLYIG
jgi:hypothetical protein